MIEESMVDETDRGAEFQNSFSSRSVGTANCRLTACITLQTAVRRYIGEKLRLNRRNLAERLLFESSVVWESFRFLNQVLVFVLLITALRLSTDEVSI